MQGFVLPAEEPHRRVQPQFWEKYISVPDGYFVVLFPLENNKYQLTVDEFVKIYQTPNTRILLARPDTAHNQFLVDRMIENVTMDKFFTIATHSNKEVPLILKQHHGVQIPDAWVTNHQKRKQGPTPPKVVPDVIEKALPDVANQPNEPVIKASRINKGKAPMHTVLPQSKKTTDSNGVIRPIQSNNITLPHQAGSPPKTALSELPLDLKHLARIDNCLFGITTTINWYEWKSAHPHALFWLEERIKALRRYRAGPILGQWSDEAYRESFYGVMMIIQQERHWSNGMGKYFFLFRHEMRILLRAYTEKRLWELVCLRKTPREQEGCTEFSEWIWKAWLPRTMGYTVNVQVPQSIRDILGHPYIQVEAAPLCIQIAMQDGEEDYEAFAFVEDVACAAGMDILDIEDLGQAMNPEFERVEMPESIAWSCYGVQKCGRCPYTGGQEYLAGQIVLHNPLHMTATGIFSDHSDDLVEKFGAASLEPLEDVLSGTHDETLFQMDHLEKLLKTGEENAHENDENDEPDDHVLQWHIEPEESFARIDKNGKLHASPLVRTILDVREQAALAPCTGGEENEKRALTGARLACMTHRVLQKQTVVWNSDNSPAKVWQISNPPVESKH